MAGEQLIPDPTTADIEYQRICLMASQKQYELTGDPQALKMIGLYVVRIVALEGGASVLELPHSERTDPTTD